MDMPWFLALPLAIGATAVLSAVIAWACDHFEPAAGYLGRDMPPGVKGATINAVGSSMPEFLTTVALLFFVGGSLEEAEELLGAGISVTAGSAVFNSVFIPMAVIFAVMAPWVIRLGLLGLVTFRGGVQVNQIELDRTAISRDLAFLIVAELALIILLGGAIITWQNCLALIGVYLVYAGFMWRQTQRHAAEQAAAEAAGVATDDDDDDEFEGMSTGKAWFDLSWTTGVLVIACYFLAEVIVGSAEAIGVHPIITALFLGAAASSVPDTILSVKDAVKGNYEDALANPIGSNTFDICVALGVPMFVYALIYGDIQIPAHDAVQALRIGLLVFTLIVVGLLLGYRYIRLWHGWSLAGLFVLWSLFALNTEFRWVPFLI